MLELGFGLTFHDLYSCAGLRRVDAAFGAWIEHADAALAAFEGLHTAPDQVDGVRAVFRALRYLPRAKEALYPLAGAVPAINRYFLDPALRDDAELLARFAAPAPEGEARRFPATPLPLDAPRASSVGEVSTRSRRGCMPRCRRGCVDPSPRASARRQRCCRRRQ